MWCIQVGCHERLKQLSGNLTPLGSFLLYYLHMTIFSLCDSSNWLWISFAYSFVFLSYSVIDELDSLWVPLIKTWRLNERMYGALTGLSKKMIRQRHGPEQVCLFVIESRAYSYFTRAHTNFWLDLTSLLFWLTPILIFDSHLLSLTNDIHSPPWTVFKMATRLWYQAPQSLLIFSILSRQRWSLRQLCARCTHISIRKYDTVPCSWPFRTTQTIS